MLFRSADVNLFKRLPWLQRIQPAAGGRWSGLVLGLSLGLVWIPCVGPMLSGVLALVAARGTLLGGVSLLLVVLTTLLSFISILSSWTAIKERVKRLLNAKDITPENTVNADTLDDVLGIVDMGTPVEVKKDE